MSSNKPQEQKLIDEINHHLEQKDAGLATVVRKAARLARLRNEHEYRLLFDFHLAGLSQNESDMAGVGIERWPANVKPKWDILKALQYDRAIGDGTIFYAPLEQIDEGYKILQREIDKLRAQVDYESMGVLLKEQNKYGQVMTRIRNRVGLFVGQVERALAQEIVLNNASPPTVEKPVERPGGAAVKDTRNVFVVHGRNLEARNSVFRFLRAIGLAPREWSELVQDTGKGSPYIGDVLDVAFSQAQAVVVLMTPDDVAELREPFRSPHDPPYESRPTGQARPNVLFEAGMAMGRNPDRTVIVELGTVRPFSDIAGRHTVRLSNDSAARQELAQRLETAGCAVDLSGRDWHTEGDFNPPAASLQAQVREQAILHEIPLIVYYAEARSVAKGLWALLVESGMSQNIFRKGLGSDGPKTIVYHPNYKKAATWLKENIEELNNFKLTPIEPEDSYRGIIINTW